MKCSFHVALAALAGLALGFLGGRFFSDRTAHNNAGHAAFFSALDKISITQASLMLLEQQRLAPLQITLEQRLVSNIHSAHAALSTSGLPEPMPAIPNLTESVRRAGAYLQSRHISPDAVKEAEWVVGRLTSAHS